MCVGAFPEHNNSLFIVMELAKGALDIRAGTSMHAKLLLLLDIAMALQYLHSPTTSRRMRIIHRDLKYVWLCLLDPGMLDMDALIDCAYGCCCCCCCCCCVTADRRTSSCSTVGAGTLWRS